MELKGECWLICEVGSIRNTSAKERLKTVERQRRCEAPNLTRSNEKSVWNPTVFVEFGKKKARFLPVCLGLWNYGVSSYIQTNQVMQ